MDGNFGHGWYFDATVHTAATMHPSYIFIFATLENVWFNCAIMGIGAYDPVTTSLHHPAVV
jgi:hypothetical protein